MSSFSLSDYVKARKDIAATVGVAEDEIKLNHHPGNAGPWGGAGPSLAVWLPKRIDLGRWREAVRRTAEHYAPGHTVTVDHDPTSAPASSVAAVCACGYPNEYDAPSNAPGGAWKCTGCKLWSTVAGNDPKPDTSTKDVTVVTTAIPSTFPRTNVRAHFGETPSAARWRYINEQLQIRGCDYRQSRTHSELNTTRKNGDTVHVYSIDWGPCPGYLSWEWIEVTLP